MEHEPQSRQRKIDQRRQGHVVDFLGHAESPAWGTGQGTTEGTAGAGATWERQY